MASATDGEIARLRISLQEARQHYEEGLFDKAEPVFKRALFFFTEGEELRQCLVCLTNIYAIQGSYAEALESCIGLLAINEKEFGKTDSRTIAVLNQIADIYDLAEQHQKADGMRRKAHAREKAAERGETESPDLSASYKSLSLTTEEAHPKKEAITLRDKLEAYLEELRPILESLSLDLTDYRVRFYAKVIAAGIVVMVVMGIISFLPRSQTAVGIYSQMPHNYETADGKSTFKLVDLGNCFFQRNLEPIAEGDKATRATPQVEDPNQPSKMEMTYSQYLPDWRDAWAMAFGNIYEKEYWVHRIDDSIIDEEGRAYYGREGKENKVLEKMKEIKDVVNAYVKETGKYPDHLPTTLRAYDNPFTNATEQPTCQTVEVGNDKCTTAFCLEQRKNLYRALMDGSSWKDEPPLHPGAINTCCVVARSEAGEFYDFIVQGCDRHGKSLQSSEPGKAYILSVSGAKELSSPVPAVPFSGKLLVRPRRAWIIAPEIDQNSLFFVRHGLSFMWGFLGLCFLAYCIFKQYFLGEWQRSDFKFVSYMAGCVVMIMIYEFSLNCP